MHKLNTKISIHVSMLHPCQLIWKAHLFSWWKWSNCGALDIIWSHRVTLQVEEKTLKLFQWKTDLKITFLTQNISTGLRCRWLETTLPLIKSTRVTPRTWWWLCSLPSSWSSSPFLSPSSGEFSLVNNLNTELWLVNLS